MNNKNIDRLPRKQKRVRSKLQGTAKRPRLSVYRSSKYMYAQLIDDTTQKTILGVSEKTLTSKEKKGHPMELGKLLAEKAKEQKIKTVVFDRGIYNYHGKVKAFADAVREGGLVF